MEQERDDGRDRAGNREAGGEEQFRSQGGGHGARRENGTEPDPVGPGQAAREPASERTDKGDTRPSWLEILLPVLVLLIIFTLVLLWNIVAAIVVLIIGAAVILSWVIQRHQPHEPGE
jgi:Flp pilus assembly protein TadB